MHSTMGVILTIAIVLMAVAALAFVGFIIYVWVLGPKRSIARARRVDHPNEEEPEEEEEEEEEEDAEESSAEIRNGTPAYKKWSFWIIFWVIYSALMSTSITFAKHWLVIASDGSIMIQQTDPADEVSFAIQLGWITISLLITYLVGSLIGPNGKPNQVNANEMGGLFLFGDFIQEVGPGLMLVPMGLCKMEKVSTLQHEEEFPGNPEDIWYGDPKEGKIPDGMRMPLRVTFLAEPQKEKADRDPFKSRITTEVFLVLVFRISNFLGFFKSVGSIENFRRVMEDALTGEAQELLPKRTLGATMLDLNNINRGLKEKAIEWLGQSKLNGVQILDARIKSMPLDHTLNEAIRDAAASIAKANKTRQEADGIAYKVKEEGIAANDVLEDLRKKLGLTAEEMIALRVGEQLSKNGNIDFIVGDTGVANIGRQLAIGAKSGSRTTKPRRAS